MSCLSLHFLPCDFTLSYSGKMLPRSDASFWARPEYGKPFGRILGILSLSWELCNTKNFLSFPIFLIAYTIGLNGLTAFGSIGILHKKESCFAGFFLVHGTVSCMVFPEPGSFAASSPLIRVILQAMFFTLHQALCLQETYLLPSWTSLFLNN